ncbi:hypothetical protein Q0N71_20145 [Bacillus thuringiensis]|uniref:hypothetical protein n=1 Tax=Bacillus thuringiensis TaxID=1428 RepID=UPI0034597A04
MADFILALVFVFFAAVLKYAVARTSSGVNVFKAVLELPVDLLFACIAFLATYMVMISDAQTKKAIQVVLNGTADKKDLKDELVLPFFQTTQGGVMLIVCYLLVTTIVIICWRKSEEYFNVTGMNKKSVLITGLGYLLTITSILFIVSLIKAVK